MALGIHSVPERPVHLDESRARAVGIVWTFFSRLSYVSSSSHSL